VILLAAKEPVLLVVLIETATLAWRIAGVDLHGTPHPLMRSEARDLDRYRGVSFDEQVSFLRHRLSGVLQRGCDRLWGRQMKPCQIVFIADGPFPDAPPQLTQAVADHFVQWMVNPPVAFFLRRDGGSVGPLEKTAGEFRSEQDEPLREGLAALAPMLQQSEVWEVAPAKPRG
jgi:hypothetical protein